jgi:hypothetical protein
VKDWFKTGEKFQESQIKDLFTTYRKSLEYVNIFEEEDIKQEYELFKLYQKENDCFDFFFKNLLNKSSNREEITEKYIFKNETGEVEDGIYSNRNWWERKELTALNKFYLGNNEKKINKYFSKIFYENANYISELKTRIEIRDSVNVNMLQ